jgi:hypothetical protein
VTLSRPFWNASLGRRAASAKVKWRASCGASRAEIRAIKAERRKQAKIMQVLTLFLPTRHASATQKTEYVWMRLGMGPQSRGPAAL